MGDLEWMRSTLPGTYVSESIGPLLDIYEEIDAEIDRFKVAAGIGCPAGCGVCCTNTDPEVTSMEADLLAVYLSLRDTAALLVESAHEGSGCIFYNPAHPLHCQVYPARPMLCRGFAFTSVRDKKGEPVFRFCRQMPAPGPRMIAGSALQEAFPEQPPELAKFGRLACLISQAGPPGRVPLSQAIVESHRRVGFIVSLSRLDPTDDDRPVGGGRAA